LTFGAISAEPFAGLAWVHLDTASFTESGGVSALIGTPRPDAETGMRQLPAWIAHYNEAHPHKALAYRSPREFIAAHARP